MTAHACIVGVGETDYCRKPGSGKSNLGLLLEASTRAIADAGLAPSDIDGIMPFMRSVSAEELAVGQLYPNLGRLREVSRAIAEAVALEAMASEVSPRIEQEELVQRLSDSVWEPVYPELEPA